MEPEKKISFGFSKITKKTVLLNKPEEKKVELVECLEGQSIKVKDAIEIVDEPLIIPIKNTKNSLIDRIREAQSKEKSDSKTEVKDVKPDSELTIDELAERELIKDAQNRLTNTNSNGSALVLPIKEDKLELEGEEESTLEDYEKIPIQDFGTAMLRGMGWKEGSGIGKNPTKTALLSAPELRPKGLGLGASKLIKSDTSKDTLDKEGKPLILKKGTFAKIIAGSHKGQYGEVLGLDDEAARVIVKTAIKRDILTLNEFLVIPVTKEEYTKCSNVLNNAKLEEYKEQEKKMQHLDKLKDENSDSGSKDHRNCNTTMSSHSDHNKKYSSNDTDLKRTEVHKSSKKDKSRDKDYSSDTSNSESERSSKVHKRKDKRRHRDKSRSPHRRHSKHGNSKKSSKSKYRSSSSSDSDYEKRRRDKDRCREENKSRKCKR